MKRMKTARMQSSTCFAVEEASSGRRAHQTLRRDTSLSRSQVCFDLMFAISDSISTSGRFRQKRIGGLRSGSRRLRA